MRISYEELDVQANIGKQIPNMGFGNNEGGLVILRARDWGQKYFGLCYSGVWQTLWGNAVYYPIDITSGGVVTSPVDNKYYITRFY